MLKAERRILEWVEKNLWIIAIVAISIAGLAIRFVLRDFVSPDSESFLIPWYNIIKEDGGIHGLYRQVGNYNMLYQLLIALMTYLPIEPLYAYKILSCLFDFSLAVCVASIVYNLTDNKDKWSWCWGYALVLLSPIVLLNSSAWAQCDSIYTFFIIAAIFAFVKDKYLMTFILYGFALAFKLQAVFILPFFLFVYFVKKKFSALYFALIPAVMCVTAIPCIAMGRIWREIYYVYRKQVDYYKIVHMNYPSFWTILNDSAYTTNYEAFKWMAILFTVAVLGIIMIGLAIKKVNLNEKNLIYIAFLLAYTCVLFLPGMHERYGFCYEILAIIIVFLNKKTTPLLILLGYLSLSTYGCYLFETEINMVVLTVVNVITYLGYWKLLGKEMCNNI